MTEPDWKHCDEKAMWQWVASHLEHFVISRMLVGGAAAAVHSTGAYQSGDIDLLIDSYPLHLLTPAPQHAVVVWKQAPEKWQYNSVPMINCTIHKRLTPS